MHFVFYPALVQIDSIKLPFPAIQAYDVADRDSTRYGAAAETHFRRIGGQVLRLLSVFQNADRRESQSHEMKVRKPAHEQGRNSHVEGYALAHARASASNLY